MITALLIGAAAAIAIWTFVSIARAARIFDEELGAAYWGDDEDSARRDAE